MVVKVFELGIYGLEIELVACANGFGHEGVRTCDTNNIYRV